MRHLQLDLKGGDGSLFGDGNAAAVVKGDGIGAVLRYAEMSSAG